MLLHPIAHSGKRTFPQGCPSALQPAATHGEHLANKAVGCRTAQIRGEFGTLAGTDHAAERHLAFQLFLKAWVGLLFRREVGRVVEKVVRRSIAVRKPNARTSSTARD